VKNYNIFSYQFSPEGRAGGSCKIQVIKVPSSVSINASVFESLLPFARGYKNFYLKSRLYHLFQSCLLLDHFFDVIRKQSHNPGLFFLIDLCMQQKMIKYRFTNCFHGFSSNLNFFTGFPQI